MILLLYVFTTVVIFFFTVGYFLSAPAHKGSVTEHFNGTTFINPTGVKAKGLGDVLKWMLARKQGSWSEVKRTTFGEKPTQEVNVGIRITFVNHTTFLIQTENLNILTDPVWSERTSPFSFAGPKRMRPPGIRLEDLPKIDLILLSHNHYDHLDVNTMQQVVKKHKPRIITPLGVKNFLEQENMKGAQDMDWWQEVKISESLIIQSVPAQHFSGRGMFDRDKTLWCGYVIKRKEGNLYFAADTGYNERTFKEIGERCAPITVSILPIGAYKPNWFMAPIHTSPADAIKIFLDTKTKAAVASHFGTFPLADDGAEDPINDLAIALRVENLSIEKFIILPEGTHKDF